MSRQLQHYFNTLNFSNICVYNKKKNQVKDNYTVIQISLNPLDCKFCGKPKGKLLLCKHILFYFIKVLNLSLVDISLIGCNEKYKDHSIPITEECCICLDTINKLETQCLQCGQLYHTKCYTLNECAICKNKILKFN